MARFYSLSHLGKPLKGNAGEMEALRKRTGVSQARRRQIAAQMHQAAHELAQANVNWDALKGF